MFNVFEPRYKLMVKECIDQGRPLLVVGSRDDAVGALCRVGDAKHAADGGSVVVLHCERLAKPTARKTSRSEFGLSRAVALEAVDAA